MMLASPLYPASAFSPQHTSEETSQYRPTRDLEAFNSLLPPPIEFIEGSSSGALAVPEGKYEPINATPKPSKADHYDNPKPPALTPVKDAGRRAIPSNVKGTSLYTGVIDTTWPQTCSVGTGLYNTGNTCFLNSALQCLMHTPPLIRVLLPHTAECRVKSGFCMACNMKAVTVKAHSGKSAFVPVDISSKLQVIAKHMRKGRQEDSHEFLRYAIDALQKSCLAGYPPKIDHKLMETTWVHKIFGGKLRSRVTCGECKHNSDTFDSILDLSLDITHSNDLKSAFRKFVAVDFLKGADKYKCERCKKAVTAEKRFTVHDAPLVLTIHLKRFSPVGRKIGHHVQYDEHLSLRPVMSEGQFGPTYSLYGVICHAGGGPNSGHYIAHVKSRDGTWWEMNDELVTRTRAPVALKNAYILFYMREKGQALEAAVANVSTPAPPHQPKNGVAASMKKRKAKTDSDDENEDQGVQADRPFIGPQLPPSDTSDAKRQKTNPSDPQADLIGKKIQAVSYPSRPLVDDYDSESDKGEKVDAVLVVEHNNARSSPPAPPPTSSPAPPPSPGPIPSSSFYSSTPTNGKKRKSPDDENNAGKKEWAREHIPISPLFSTSTPSNAKYRQSLSTPYKKYPLGGNPFSSRITGGNNLGATYSKKKFRQHARGV